MTEFLRYSSIRRAIAVCVMTSAWGCFTPCFSQQQEDSAQEPCISCEESQARQDNFSWLEGLKVGYDEGFVIASEQETDLQSDHFPFRMQINGWGQLRETSLASDGPSPDINQFQLKRARLVFEGSAFTDDFEYFIQLDGRSSSGDDVRLLDFYLTYDLGHHGLGLDRGKFGFKTGKYKMPFTMARYMTAKETEFTDRSVASTFFDVNRSLAWGLFGQVDGWRIPWNWEVAIFNGLVTGGAETGSSGNLDNNFAFSARAFSLVTGDWGTGELADFDWHENLATRIGIGYANSRIQRAGSTEFSALRVVDSGVQLSTLLPATVSQYEVNLFAIDTSSKFRGWTTTLEYYFRTVDGFEGATVGPLYDHGFWFQLGKFVVPRKLQLLTRWSRVVGDSGTLGAVNQSSEEIAGGIAWYFRDQHAKFTADMTYLDGAPINSSALDITPGEQGWLFRTQIQFAF